MIIHRMVKVYFDSFEPIRSMKNVRNTQLCGWLRFVAAIFSVLLTAGILPTSLYLAGRCIQFRDKENRTTTDQAMMKLAKKTRVATTAEFLVEQSSAPSFPEQEKLENFTENIELPTRDLTFPSIASEISLAATSENTPESPHEVLVKTINTEFAGRVTWTKDDAFWDTTLQMKRGDFLMEVSKRNSYGINIQSSKGAIPFQLFPQEDLFEKLKILLSIAVDDDVEMMGRQEHEPKSEKVIIKLVMSGDSPMLSFRTDGSQINSTRFDLSKLSVDGLNKEIEKAKQANREIRTCL